MRSKQTKYDANREMQRVRRLLGKTSPSDFDGHTEFRRLTAEERLMWLSQCAQFVMGIKL